MIMSKLTEQYKRLAEQMQLLDEYVEDISKVLKLDATPDQAIMFSFADVYKSVGDNTELLRLYRATRSFDRSFSEAYVLLRQLANKNLLHGHAVCGCPKCQGKDASIELVESSPDFVLRHRMPIMDPEISSSAVTDYMQFLYQWFNDEMAELFYPEAVPEPELPKPGLSYAIESLNTVNFVAVAMQELDSYRTVWEELLKTGECQWHDFDNQIRRLTCLAYVRRQYQLLFSPPEQETRLMDVGGLIARMMQGMAGRGLPGE